jgi:hypothetical protein
LGERKVHRNELYISTWLTPPTYTSTEYIFQQHCYKMPINDGMVLLHLSKNTQNLLIDTQPNIKNTTFSVTTTRNNVTQHSEDT